MTTLLEETRKIVKSCIVAVGGKTTIELLDKDYRTNENEPIPIGKLGYRSVEHFLRNQQDLVMVTGHGRSAVVQLVENKDSKTQHLQNMIRAQKQDAKFKKRFERSAGIQHSGRTFSFRPIQRNQPQSKRQIIPTFWQMSQQQQALQSLMQIPIVQAPVNPSLAAQMFHMIPENRTMIPTQVFKQNTYTRSSNNAAVTNPVPFPPPPPVAAAEMPKSPEKSQEKKSSSSEYHEEEDLFGEFSDWNTDITSICPPPGYGSRISPHAEPTSLPNDSISTQIDKNIERLENFNVVTPIPQAALNTVSDESFDEEEFGVQAGSSDGGALPDWVYDDLMTVPKNMAGYRDVIREPRRPDILPIGGWKEIFITDIHSPHKFYFHIDDDKEDIDNLMHSLKIFYSRPSSAEFRVELHEIRINLLIAAVYLGLWHRAKIISNPFYVNREPMVKVFYIDYGTVHNVATDEIRFLHKQFLEYDQFSHRGSLSGLLPVGDSWARDVTNKFLNMVMDKKLFAMTHTYFAPDRSWHVELVDPEPRPYVNINVNLIESDMARDYDSEDLQEYMNYYKTHKPTFDELENGSFLTHFELTQCDKNMIDYNPDTDRENESVLDNDYYQYDEARVMEPDRTLYLNENNPFIPNLLQQNIRVVVVGSNRHQATSSSSVADKMNIPFENFDFNDQKVVSKNPFVIHINED